MFAFVIYYNVRMYEVVYADNMRAAVVLFDTMHPGAIITAIH